MQPLYRPGSGQQQLSALRQIPTVTGQTLQGRSFLDKTNGWLYPGLDMTLFRKLKSLKAIASSKGMPYRITSRGLKLVRSQLDNR